MQGGRWPLGGSGLSWRGEFGTSQQAELAKQSEKKVVFLQVGNFTLLLADINELCLWKASVRQVL